MSLKGSNNPQKPNKHLCIFVWIMQVSEAWMPEQSLQGRIHGVLHNPDKGIQVRFRDLIIEVEHSPIRLE